MRRRLTFALSALSLAVASVLTGFGVGRPAGADIPAGLTIVDTTQCSDGNPFVGFKVTNADPANPVTLKLQFGYEGGSMGYASDFVVVTDNQAASFTDAGATARLLLTDAQGATVYDTGFVDPCATAEPAIWFEYDCTDTEMTMWVEIRNLPAGQPVVVSRQEGGGHSGNSVTTAPSTWPVTLSPMEVGRIQVHVAGTTVFDSGELHLAADGSCNEPVPALEDGPAIGLSSACTDGGARLSLSLEGDGEEVTYEWTVGEDETDGSAVAGPGVVVTQDAPLGATVGVSVYDAWSRSLLAEEEQAVTGDEPCTAAVVADLAPVLAVECRAGDAVAILGARNDGNVTTDATVHWSVDQANGFPPDGHFDAVLPGETRALEVPVPFGAEVSVYASDGGGHEDVGEEVDLTAPVACDEPGPDPQEPEGPSTPQLPRPSTPVPGATPAPGAPPVLPGSDHGAAVAGTQAVQGTLPRTGGDLAGLVAAGLGLVTVGGGFVHRARRR